MVGKVAPVKQRQRGRAAGMGVFHINAVKPQQREAHRKRARRSAVRAGENFLQPGLHFQRGLARCRQSLKSPAITTGSPSGRALVQSASICSCAAMRFPQTEMHSQRAPENRDPAGRYGNTATHAFRFRRRRRPGSRNVQWDNATTPHFRDALQDRPHCGRKRNHSTWCRPEIRSGRVGPVFEVHRMDLVRAHHFLQADNVRADGANRVAQLR